MARESERRLHVPRLAVAACVLVRQPEHDENRDDDRGHAQHDDEDKDEAGHDVSRSSRLSTAEIRYGSSAGDVITTRSSWPWG